MTSPDELLKYKELLDSGAITQAEYDEKKKQLLGNKSKANAGESSSPQNQAISALFGLIIAIGVFIYFAYGSDLLASKPPPPPPAPPAPVQTPDEYNPGPGPHLQVESWRWWNDSSTGYIIAEGEITNIGSKALAIVQPMFTVYDESDQLVGTDTGYVDLYKSLAPGQSTPFKASISRPSKKGVTAKIEFISHGGRKLQHTVVR